MKAEFITIGDKKIAIGLKWSELNSSNKWMVKNNLSKILKEKKLKYAAISPISHEKKTQYVIFDNFSSKEPVYPAASFLVEELKGFIFVKKIEDDSAEERFWVVSIDINGQVLDGEDKIITGVEELEEQINTMADLTNLKIAVHENDEEDLRELFEINKVLNDAVFELYDNLEQIKVKVYVKKEIKGLKTTAAVILALGLGLGGVIYFHDDSLYQDISTGAVNNKLKKYQKSIKIFKNELKKNSRKKELSQEEYTEKAKKQIKDLFESQFYTNKSIINNMISLDEMLPLYLVEWKLLKFAYTKNQFLIIYQKINDSIGVYSDLDEEMRNISSYYNIGITPVALEANGTKRIYLVRFDDGGRSDAFFARKLEEENKIPKIELLKEVEKDISKLDRGMKRIVKKVSEYDIFTRTFGDSVEIAYQEILNYQKKLTDVYEKAMNIIEKEDDPIIIPKGYLDGNIMKHIEVTQRLTEYQWNYPSSPLSYPIIKGTKNENLKPYAKSFKIVIAPLEGVTNSFYHMSEVADTLDTDNIIFKKVEYETSKNLWIIEADLFEKF